MEGSPEAMRYSTQLKGIFKELIRLVGSITNDIIKVYKPVERCYRMDINFFEHRDIVTKNLLTFIRNRGYSKLSLSKQTGIPRLAIDQLLNPENPNPMSYNDQMSQIMKTFDLPSNYFVTTVSNIGSTLDHNIDEDPRSPRTQELLDGLDNVLDIFSIYLK